MSVRNVAKRVALTGGGLFVAVSAIGVWLVTRLWVWLAIIGYVLWVKL